MKKTLAAAALLIAVMLVGGGILASCAHVCKFGEWQVVTEPTCVSEGLKERYCTVDGCGEKEQKPIPVDSTKHKLEPVDGEDADCTTDGTVAHNHCSLCGKNFDAQGNELDNVTVPKGHNVDKDSLLCSACGKYIISTAADLAAFRDSVNGGNNYAGKTVVLEADIALTGEWTPIGNEKRSGGDVNKYFKGTFDGQNHKITGVNVTDNEDEACVGLFGVTANAAIKNLTVKGSFTNTVDTVAAIVGCDLSAADEKTVIDNCSVDATVNGNCVGGIMARAYGTGETVISNCTVDGELTTDANGKAGGILCINAAAKSLTVSECVNNASVTGGKAGTAGILAYANKNVTITDCINNGQIGTAADRYVAGILGYQAQENVKIQNCVNKGEITGINAGGIYGIHGRDQIVTITDCVNNGLVTGNIAGGIASGASGTFTQCVNTAAISGSASGEGMAGGIIGTISGGANTTITGCSGGKGTVTAQYAGRLIGVVHNGNPSVSYLSIDDSNGDSYENGLSTVGCVGAYTAYSTMVVTEGTMRGKAVSFGQSRGWIVISEQAKWMGYDETAGKTTWNWSYDTNDFEKTNTTPLPLQ